MPDAVEVRVHGIGDHDDWSELGSPTLVSDGSPRGADIALPPTLPAHPLLLVNWSRTSRRRAGWLWYLALPYTLVNAAGYMDDAAGDEIGGRSLADRHTRVSAVLV